MAVQAEAAKNGFPVFYLESLQLRNFRKFEDFEVGFARRFTLLIGTNGSGKSSVLGALTIALNELIPYHVGGKDVLFRISDVHAKLFETGTHVFLEPQFPAEITAKGSLLGIGGSWKRIRRAKRTTVTSSNAVDQYCLHVTDTVTSGGSKTIPVIASYMISRLSWEVRNKPKFAKTASRFRAITNSLFADDDFDYVLDWWKTQEYETLKDPNLPSGLEPLKEAIRKCVEGAEDAQYDFRDEQLLIKIKGNWVSLSHASSGYKQFIMVILTLAWRATVLNPHLAVAEALKVPGIVIIDELDAHLHPEWQRRVIYDLLMTFPNIQFIASTHSPFIIQGLPKSDETIIFRLDDEVHLAAEEQSIESIAEEVQGISTTERSFAFEVQADKLYEALNTVDRSPKETSKKIERLISEEPLDPATKALLQLRKMTLEPGEKD